jgi:UPF0176 protein
MTTPPLHSSSALQHSAFYRFAPLPQPRLAADAVRAAARGLQGSVVLAREGINGTVAGTSAAVNLFEATITGADFLGGAFSDMAFKRSACLHPPFGRLKVSVKPEIVALGLAEAVGASTALPAPDENDPSHLSPSAWRALLAQGKTVVLDNRNHFEYRLGHFRGAQDPQVHNFRDFVAYVLAHAPTWLAQQRPVAMYCTGGIRCDKTAPWLRSLGLQVWQLDGGILNYFAQLPDAAQDWQGECFVFDKRVALDTQLQVTTRTVDEVFDPRHPDEAWRLQRARQLDADPG